MMKMMLTTPEQKLAVGKESKYRNNTQGTLYTHIRGCMMFIQEHTGISLAMKKFRLEIRRNFITS